MAGLAGIDRRTGALLANGLAGVIDRWKSEEAAVQTEGFVLFETIGRHSAERTNQIFYAKLEEQLGLNAGRGREEFRDRRIAANHNIAAAEAIREELLQIAGINKAEFGLREWGLFLPQKRGQYDVVFIGAGPVALWTAILAKIQSAALRILLCEKRTQYVRDHTLGIEISAFEGYPQNANPDLDRLVSGWKARRAVPIREVEHSLLDLARRLQIQVEYIAITTPGEVPGFFPEARVFVGSDGARSLVRNQIFDDNFSFSTAVKRLIQIKYQISREAGIAFGPKTFATVSKMRDLTLINERSDGVRKTLTFSAPEAVFTQVANATFANPYTLQTPGLSDSVKNAFFLWSGKKECEDGEVRVPGSETITGINGEARISRYMVKEQAGQFWCLLGDAAASFPLQRGFNVWLAGGIELGKALAGNLQGPLLPGNGVDGTAPEPLLVYGAFGASIEGRELCFLQCPLDRKKRGIGAWEAVTAIGSAVGLGLDAATSERYIEAGRNPGRTPRARLASDEERFRALHRMAAQGAQQ